MKKLLTGFVATIVLTTGFGFNANAENVKSINNPKLEADIAQLEAELFTDNKVGVTVDDVGYVVLDTEENQVVAKVTEELKCGSNVENVFDKNDTLFLDQRYKKGTIVLITFDGDQITEVKMNNLNIAGKVIGQKITKKKAVFTYKVTKKYKDGRVMVSAMSDFSPENSYLILSNKRVKGGLKKGDVVMVTFTQYYGDEIKSIKKLQW